MKPIVDAIVLDLANEISAATGPGWMGDASTDDLPLPRLDTLERLAFPVDRYAGLAGNTLRALAARILFLARSQTAWWEAMPPLRWMRRRPAVERRIARQVRRWLAATFPAHGDRIAEDIAQLTEMYAADHKSQRKQHLAGPRGEWTMEQAQLPIAPISLTSDTELLATAESRVMTGEHYDETCAAKAADREARAKLVANAETEHAELFVR
jgi:hypothetical protein